MAGFRYHVAKYFEFSREELVSVLITASVAGFVLSFRDWGEPFSILVGLSNFLFKGIAAFCLLWVHIAVQKVAGIYYAVRVRYAHYSLYLLVGVFLTMLSNGWVPFFITGQNEYRAIHNLRVGKFRGTMAKDWEIGASAAAGALASLLLAIPFSLLHQTTGLPFFRSLTVITIMIAILSMLPFPLLDIVNPYQVYMSRLESLEGNLPGFDLFFASRSWYFFVMGLILFLSALILLFGAGWITLLFGALLGLGTMFLYMKLREHHAL